MDSTLNAQNSYNPLSSGSIAASISSSAFTNSTHTEETDTDLHQQSTFGNFESKSIQAKKASQLWSSALNSRNQDQKGVLDYPHGNDGMPYHLQQTGRGKVSIGETQKRSSYNAANIMEDPRYVPRNTSEPNSGSVMSFTFGSNILLPNKLVGGKKPFPMNVNAPSYSPDTVSKVEEVASKTSGDSTGTNADALMIELAFKNHVNKALNDKLRLVKENCEATASPGDTRIMMPNAYYQIFRDLTRTLNERTQELEETKARLDSIVMGLLMTKDPAVTKTGSFDAQDLAHRITTKMAVLQAENDALLDMVSRSNKQSLVIELNLLRAENKVLRQGVSGK